MAREKKEKRGNIFERKKSDFFSDFFSFPPDAFKNFPSIHIKGNREIIIDGCTGLLNFSPEHIVVETKFCKMAIQGKSLNLHNLTEKIISIRGYIQKFEFTM